MASEASAAIRPHAAEHHGKLARARPLHGEGLLHGREVVEADGHQHRREVDPPHRGQEADEGDPDPHHREGEDREGLLAPHEQHEDDGEREKARYFPQALEDADLAARERRLLDHEVVDEDRPGLEGDGARGGEEEEQDLRAPPAALEHPRPVGEDGEAGRVLPWRGHRARGAARWARADYCKLIGPGRGRPEGAGRGGCRGRRFALDSGFGFNVDNSCSTPASGAPGLRPVNIRRRIEK